MPLLPDPPAPHELPVVRALSAFGSLSLTSAPDAIPFRTYAVAESTDTHGHRGAQSFWPPKPDCFWENKLPGN
jgi:hypothetical protein